MQQVGSPVTYPVKWDSDKQRKAFFATNGFGKGIPYVRTNQYVNGWQVAQFANGYSISNKHPAGAIGGTITETQATSPQAIGQAALQSWQSRIHKNRWKKFLPIVLENVSKLSKRVIEKLRIKT
jgi:hypothetical protein